MPGIILIPEIGKAASFFFFFTNITYTTNISYNTNITYNTYIAYNTNITHYKLHTTNTTDTLPTLLIISSYLRDGNNNPLFCYLNV